MIEFPTAPNLLDHGSFHRCAALLDYVESQHDIMDGEDIFAWLDRKTALGDYFWREVAKWWTVMDGIEHENMAMFFDQFREEWTLDCLSDADRRAWQRLTRNKEITVYRGQHESVPVGLAWTTCRKQAEWFANAGLRGYTKGSPVILTAKIWKQDVALCLTGRSEKEIVPFAIPTEYTVERLVSDQKRAA